MGMNTYLYTLVNGASMGANITSAAQPLPQGFLFNVQAVWTGSPVGNLSLAISNDNVTYSTYTLSSQATGGVASDFTWILASPAFPYIKVLYTRTSGTGTLTVTVFQKGS